MFRWQLVSKNSKSMVRELKKNSIFSTWDKLVWAEGHCYVNGYFTDNHCTVGGYSFGQIILYIIADLI